MDVYNVWLYFASMIAIFIFFKIPIFKFLDETPQATPHRFSSLDGLRGILSLSVVMHHLAVNYGYQKTGLWEVPPSGFYTLLGQVGVSLFFMITGFLFTGKLATHKPIRWIELYIGRLFRIGPLYILAVLIMIAIVFFETKFQIKEPPTKILREVITWLSFGVSSSKPNINDYASTNIILAGVTWTIHYEWLFYISLLFISILRNQLRYLSVFLVIFSLSALQLTHNEKFAYAALFSCGMTARMWATPSAVYGKAKNLLSMVAITALIILFSQYSRGYSVAPIILAFIAFFCICKGADFFGVLVFSGTRRVGDISYGVYLLQGIPIFLIFSIPSVKAWGMASHSHYWMLCLACLVSLLALSILGYAWVEKPFIAAGKVVGEQIRSRFKRTPETVT